MDANGWVLVITAVFLGAAKLWSMWLDYLRARDAAAQAEQVRQTLKTTTAAVSGQLANIAETGNEVAAVVEQVHKATNSDRDRAERREAAMLAELKRLQLLVTELRTAALAQAKRSPAEPPPTQENPS